MKRSLGVTMLFALCAVGVTAMILEMPLAQLVAESETIVVAVVTQQTEKSAVASETPSVLTVLEVERCLKGSAAASSTLEIETLGDLAGSVKVEDEPRFPAVGRRVVLFAHTAPNGRLAVTNLLQGVWPIDADGSLLKMGTGKTLAEVEAEIAHQKTHPYVASPAADPGSAL